MASVCIIKHIFIPGPRPSSAKGYAQAQDPVWGEYEDRLRRTPEGWRIHRRDYSTFFVEGDDRMTFGGQEPDWEKTYRD